MNTTACKFYRAGSVTRAALDFNDAEIGELVSTYTDSDDNNIALIVDRNGNFVTTLAGLVKVTGIDRRQLSETLSAQISVMASEYVAPISLSEFKRELNNLIYKICKADQR